jgi:hypothetical protein
MTMAIDPDLLGQARQSGERVLAAERDVETTRAEYHHAIRRLHLGGASQREIAAALGLSHQRVHQIVSEGGGSWWSRAWRSRNEKPRDLTCSFCGRSRDHVDKLIAGPAVHICDACIQTADQAIAEQASVSTTQVEMKAVILPAKAKCSFCGKLGKHDVAATGKFRICTACLAMCHEILSAHQTPSDAC